MDPPAAEPRELLPQLGAARAGSAATVVAAASAAAASAAAASAIRGGPAAASDAATSDDGHDAAPLKSNRGAEELAELPEHRADPALRAALERLDDVRQRQPTMDDFALERYLGRQRPSGPSAPAPLAGATSAAEPGFAPEAAALDGGLAASAGAARRLAPCFSTDLLLAAVRAAAPAPRRGGGLPPDDLLSRSTSPGSTQTSLLGGSLGSLSSSGLGPFGPSGPSGGLAARDAAPSLAAARPTLPLGPRPARAPAAPAAPAGRRPRPRVLSARSRRAQAAAETGLDVAGAGAFTAR